MSYDLFKEIIPSITNKKYLQLTEDDEKDYPTFMMMKWGSMNASMAEAAQVINENFHLDPKLQYDFLFHIAKTKKLSPYCKWAKGVKEENVELISKVFECSTREARDYLSILSEKDLETISSWYEMGGKAKSKRDK